jgi:erythronate-4-phosphate dehydrogenase
MKIIADNKIPFLKGVFEPFCDIDYIRGNEICKQDLSDVQVLIIRTRTVCDETLLKGSDVKFIATATIGFDHIDTGYCANNNIQWINAPGCNSGGVQHWFMAALLYHAQKNAINLSKRTLGVVGVGHVGQKIVRVAEAIGMQVLLNDPPRERVEGSCAFRSLERIIRECDIISFHVPLVRSGEDKTYPIVDEAFCGKINKGTILINSSRGEVIQTEALKNAFIQKQVSSVLLDVWENEPSIDVELLSNTSIGTPHIAGYSTEGKANGTAMAVKAVGEFLDLPFDDWYPSELPVPENLILNVNCKNKSLQDVLTEVVLESYPIYKDDAALKAKPLDFESFRANYKVRREPQAWKIYLTNSSLIYKKALEGLGFKVEAKN